MKNNRFHDRKASGPAALNLSNAAANTLQVKHFMMQQSNDRLSNFEANQKNSVEYLDAQFKAAQKAAAAQGNSTVQTGNTRTSSRQGARLASGQGNSQGGANQPTRPSSKSLNRAKDKQAQ